MEKEPLGAGRLGSELDEPPPEDELPPPPEEEEEELELLDDPPPEDEEELLEELLEEVFLLTVIKMVSLSVKLPSETKKVTLKIPVRWGSQENSWLIKVAPVGRLVTEKVKLSDSLSVALIVKFKD